MSTIEQRIIKIISEQLGAEERDVKSESHIVNHLGADSLDEVELVMSIEDEFDIEISNSDAEAAKTVQDIINYITARVSA